MFFKTIEIDLGIFHFLKNLSLKNPLDLKGLEIQGKVQKLLCPKFLENFCFSKISAIVYRLLSLGITLFSEDCAKLKEKKLLELFFVK